MTTLDWLFNPTGLTPHGFCLSWSPSLVALHVGSDALVGLAYFSIPLALGSFAGRRKDLQYSWVLYLFVAFILACGTTHLMSILTLWVPAYGIEGLIKLITALLSVGTAAILWPLIPILVATPSPSQLARLNAELESTIAEQAATASLLRDSEARVRAANFELERRVADQTAELRAANAQLSEALAQRTSALQALEKTEEEYRVSFEAASVGKVQVEPASARILRTNAHFAHMLGYQPEELAGRVAWELTWSEDLADDRAEYARFLAGEVLVYAREKRYRRRDGTPIWGRISGSLVRAETTQEPLLMVAVIEDVDAQHKAQAHLVAARQELETVVEQRTAALQQRDILLREVYHRVKNNLQLIDSLLSLQARQLKDPEAEIALESLRRRVHALGLVHQQLMDSADLRAFEIGPFLRELSGNVVEAGAGQGVHLIVQAIPLAVGLDFAIPIGLIVSELVSNSLKHAFPEGVGTISVLVQLATSGMIALVVADDGRGFAAGTSTPSRYSHGMGTRIVAALVSQLGGTMTITADRGTRTEILVQAPVLT